MQRLLQHTRNSASSRRGAWWSPLLRAIGLAVAVGVAYFLVARLSLALLTKPDCVAVFWPAAGIASGTLIALGPRQAAGNTCSTDRKRRGKSSGDRNFRPPSYSPCAMPEKPYW